MKRNEESMKDIREINRIHDFMYQNRLKVVKLNHAVDSDAQRF